MNVTPIKSMRATLAAAFAAATVACGIGSAAPGAVHAQVTPSGAPPVRPAPRAPQAPQAPQVQQVPLPVVLEPPMIDFGVVAPGTKHPGRFTLRNTGTDPVTVGPVTPSCKCTDISPITGKVIPPGGTLELTAALSVPNTPGDKDAKVYITFAGMRGMLTALMKADVTLPIRATPAYVDALKGVTSGVVRLSSVDGKPFQVRSVGGKPPVLVDDKGAFVADPSAPATAHNIKWSLAGVPADQLQQWMVVETDRSDCILIPLRVRHERTGVMFDPRQGARFWFPPESIVMGGALKAGTPVELTTVIEHYNPGAQGRVTNPAWSQVQGVRAAPAFGTAELVSATPRDTNFVDVVFRFTPAANVRGAVYAPVEIQTATGAGNVYISAVVTE